MDTTDQKLTKSDESVVRTTSVKARAIAHSDDSGIEFLTQLTTDTMADLVMRNLSRCEIHISKGKVVAHRVSEAMDLRGRDIPVVHGHVYQGSRYVSARSTGTRYGWKESGIPVEEQEYGLLFLQLSTWLLAPPCLRQLLGKKNHKYCFLTSCCMRHPVEKFKPGVSPRVISKSKSSLVGATIC